MSINTSVSGDPSECRATARRLHRLAATLDAAGEKLTRRSHLTVDEFGSLSGAAFRCRTTTLAGCAAEASEDSAGLARAMEKLGRRLDDVQLLMAKARQAARVSLVVDGSAIRQPEPCAPAHDQLVFDTVRQVVEGARRLEQEAQLEWQSALSRYADAEPPLPPADAPADPPGPTRPLAAGRRLGHLATCSNPRSRPPPGARSGADRGSDAVLARRTWPFTCPRIGSARRLGRNSGSVRLRRHVRSRHRQLGGRAGRSGARRGDH